MTPTLLGLCGSLRAASTNRMLMLDSVRAFGACTFVDGNLRLPLYDGDLEAAGMPPEVQTLADQITAADAVVISTPEYNKNLSGVLKNALDWVSRTKGAPWRDKPVAILSAAAGRAGGERSQFSLRHCLVPFRPRLLPGPEVFIANSGAAFDDQGRLKDDRAQKSLTELMQLLRAETAR
ncbi:MAG: NADPH-dependent FMN reductase [Pseudotabrizicola sp.]|uniref:NADPH-dependent FMN reductase n=1 Tax=Pseudotabrizicola sp. TaxID=2939647 RepID=UPI002728BE65|nr:NADPH-dependent FMN reductase [Pseudotabrizicola sp.]MDO9639484.1 NADPH-dependent FMN reductase [Pseudotabrizicola sp.]